MPIRRVAAAPPENAAGLFTRNPERIGAVNDAAASDGCAKNEPPPLTADDESTGDDANPY
jgi:hypothetical protein